MLALIRFHTVSSNLWLWILGVYERWARLSKSAGMHPEKEILRQRKWR
jgi:hypothetical protein